MNTTTPKLLWMAAVAAILLAFVTPAADAPDPLAKQLEPLRPLLGKTWKGRFAKSPPDKPMYDVSKWERALNGQAVRVLHSVDDGMYGGETIISWNAKLEKLEYYYFTTAGYNTHGTMEIKGGKFVTLEEVEGDANGVTKVEGVSELKDGKLHVKSRYFKKGAWEDGHEITYEEAPSAEVKFK